MPIFIFFMVLMASCASLSPTLSPVPQPSGPSEPEVIQVVVKPIVTKGFGSEDERKWGVDLSAYFTAFELRVRNRTSQEIFFNPSLARLMDEKNESRSPLNEEESLNHYQTANGNPIITLVPKSRERVEEETRKIKEARLSSGAIAPGGQKEGILLFEKISPARCGTVILELNGITVVESGEVKKFSFPFVCDEKN